MRLDHATLRTRHLDAHRRFFEEVFDLRDGFRPAFGFPGHWLYSGTEPVVYLIPARPGSTVPSHSGEGIDHVAFLRDDDAAFRARLDRRGIPYDRMELPEIGERRVFLHAPGGALIEVAFRERVPTAQAQEVHP
ncbi:VOC family protein [Methylobacterium sp. E-045]|uniref:VOC family protein n=1 Tax=Methylobacterium sp. E-045 TaxID=2836575 RepID=UPI001FB9D22D|nr:VOC family protein [Methylobacterium sp. E-045]MCJ2129773.1 VOC family protein [Methylobacterium sp. E-045]